jgi:glycine/D-amino acid oxidase-like deaminating enzyme
MLWGGRNNLSTNLDLNDSARQLQKTLYNAFPDLKEIPLTHTWTGQLGITFDLMPHIGRVDGVHFAFGYGGHGLSIATYVGTEAGKLLAGQISSTPFSEIPHQTMFFYRNRPWFLPMAAWYYRFLDWKS